MKIIDEIIYELYLPAIKLYKKGEVMTGFYFCVDPKLLNNKLYQAFSIRPLSQNIDFMLF